MPRNRVRQPLGENMLTAIVLSTEKASDPKLDSHRDPFPGEIAELTLISAMNPP